MEYLPSKSVAVPMEVPGIETVTPGIGAPLSSTTVPLIAIANFSILFFAKTGDSLLTLGFFTTYIFSLTLLKS